ncbi:MAG: carboxypeptidase-like regulatory domain-containing protein, partial [Thermoanaerobaculia bacterium]|nr:carboxypeptidase-like regulatory domain-containing protein [Thermoanaerobaculia bacterium]
MSERNPLSHRRRRWPDLLLTLLLAATPAAADGTLHGRVVGADGAPLAGATVRVDGAAMEGAVGRRRRGGEQQGEQQVRPAAPAVRQGIAFAHDRLRSRPRPG